MIGQNTQICEGKGKIKPFKGSRILQRTVLQD